MKTVWKAVCVVVWLIGANGISLAQDTTYRKDVKPIFDAKCAGCHGAASPTLAEFLENQKKFEAIMKGPRMDSYADLIQLIGWPDTGAVMRRHDDGKNTGGRPGNMYQYLGASEEERQKNLQTFKAWVGPEGWILKRWNARGNVPAITKDELDKIQVKY